MEPALPLRDVFAGLADQTTGPEDVESSTSDPRSALAEYDDLPDELLVTAIGSYANTAPAEVAEHLAPFVAAPGADPEEGLSLLASAPVGTWEGEVDLPDAVPAEAPNLADETLFDEVRGMDEEELDEEGPGLNLDNLDSADTLDLDGTDRADIQTIDDDDPTMMDAATASVPTLVSESATVPEHDSEIPTEVDDSDEPFLDHQITDQSADQRTDLDDLDDLQEFDEFDA